MIQIDDSGSGSLIGGTCIGVMRVETGEYYYEIISLKYYSKCNFLKKTYLNVVVDIVKKSIEILKVSRDEPIEICQGYMFDQLRLWLTSNNFQWRNVQITGQLQAAVEKTFEEYAISLGFPRQYIEYTKYPFHFHRILRWVYADYPKRVKLCKVGWKSWQKYGNLSIHTGIEPMPKKNYSCLKCGKILEPDTNIKVLRFTSNKPNIIYVHLKC